jgi:hypothetical protein
MRRLFERVATENKWLNPLHGLARSGDHADGYLDLYLQLRWEGWKAALMNTNYFDVLEAL